ncbi:MAG: tRNA lysidine(34) synthetase TilS [Metamycoplasmataceae bacterium]
MEKQNNKKLIAVSGGVDSMFLLNELKNEDIVVAYVNYNLRDDVIVDFKIINEFCKKNHLNLETYSINEKHNGNFQEWAREKRYLFFKKIYDQYNCSELITAHHKDDFLETSIMQWKSSRKPYSYGINKNNIIYGMNVNRPMIFKYWKSEIYDLAKENRIPYNDDYSNFTNKYERNKIRIFLNRRQIFEKEILLKSFRNVNVIKGIRKIEIIKKYLDWKSCNYNIEFLKKNVDFFEELIFKLLIENIDEININSNILKEIKKFLISKNENKVFMLSNNRRLIKSNNNIIIK